MAYERVGALALSGNSECHNMALLTQQDLEDIKDRMRRLSELGEYHNFDADVEKVYLQVQRIALEVKDRLRQAEEKALAQHERLSESLGLVKPEATIVNFKPAPRSRRGTRYRGR